MTPDDHAEMTKKNARLGLTVLGVVFLMVGLAYASVPLYKLFCSVTGFGGTTQVAQNLPGNVLERTVTVKFNAETNRNLAWEFEPEQREIKVRLGQRGLTAYFAHNKLSTPSTGMAVYNVTPLKAGKYFHKIECFCFNEQTLAPTERVNMPVMFFVDPSMADDPAMDDVTEITLSYTFFKAQTKELDSALDALYNQDENAIQQGTN